MNPLGITTSISVATMSLKEDFLEQMYYFRVMDWFQGNILLSRLVCGYLLLSVAYAAPLNLYNSREDRDQLLMKLMLTIGFSSVPCTVVNYWLTNEDFIELRKKAEKTFRPLQSEGPKTYDRITRSGRKVAMSLWGIFAIHLSIVIFLNFSKELRRACGIYDLIGILEISRLVKGFWGFLTTITMFTMLMFPVILISRHARWTYCIWAQIVLLQANIRSRLYGRISKYDKVGQKLCKRYLREAVRIHSDIKSIADEYYYHVRINTLLIFFPGTATAAIPLLLFFIGDLSMGVKLMMSLNMIGVALFAYVALTSIQSTIDESEKLCEMLYNCPWYDWDKSNCTILIIMMSVMKKPLLKTDVFGVMEINYKVCLKVYRVVYGIVTAVLNLN